MNNKRVRVGNTLCCVPLCSNSYRNTSKEVHFYSFPGRDHEKELRKKWIEAVKRIK